MSFEALSSDFYGFEEQDKDMLMRLGVFLDEEVRPIANEKWAKAEMRHFADAEAIYSYEGTREMNTLIVGRAITGEAAFV